MKILSITAGAGGMYCGSCLRDNALAAELIARGHDVTLMPLYTPLLTDEPNVTRPDVLFGGINVYLQQHRLDLPADAALRRSAARLAAAHQRVRRAIGLDRPEAARRSDDLDARRHRRRASEGVRQAPRLGVERADARHRQPDELDADRPGAAAGRGARTRRSAARCRARTCSSTVLTEPYQSRALDLIRRQVRDVDRFIAVSDYYAAFMSDYLRIPGDRIAVVPLGINMKGFERGAGQAESADAARDGAMSSASATSRGSRPRRGCTCWREAFIRLHQRSRQRAAPARGGRLSGAGPRSRISARCGATARARRPAGRVRVPRRRRSRRQDRVPARPRRAVGAGDLRRAEGPSAARGDGERRAGRAAATAARSREIVGEHRRRPARAPDDPDSLAEGLYSLWHDRALRGSSDSRGREGVREHYTIQHSAATLLGSTSRSSRDAICTPERLDDIERPEPARASVTVRELFPPDLKSPTRPIAAT